MSLRDTIKKILKEESKIPVSLRRRLNYLDDEKILSQLKKNSLTRNPSIEESIKNGFLNVAHDIVPYDEDMDEDELIEYVMKIEEYLLEKYYKIVKDYLQKVFNSKDMIPDGNRYVFWKHSEPSGGNGFSEGYDNWEEFIRHKGSWFPIDWWEVKSKLDEIPEGKEGKVTIKKPGDKDNIYNYYFSVIKKPDIIKEENNKKSKVQTMIDDVGLGTTIKFFGGFNNFYNRVGDNVITRQNKIDFLKEYFITNREYFVAHGGNLFTDYGEEPILLYEDDQIIKQIESFDEDGVFVDLYVKDGDDDYWESGENLPYEDVPDNVLDELFYFVMDAFQSDNMII